MKYLLSTALYDKWSAYSIICFTLVLLGSLIFYTFLAFSDCQEESEVGNQRPLRYFNIIAMPMIWISYIALFTGIITFFFSYCLLWLVRATEFVTCINAGSYWMIKVVIPTFVVLLITGAFALIISNRWRQVDSAIEAGKGVIYRGHGRKDGDVEADTEAEAEIKRHVSIPPPRRSTGVDDDEEWVEGNPIHRGSQL